MQERIKDYLAYLKDWSAVRFRQYFVFPDSFEEFCTACDAEERQADKEWSEHLQRMTCSRRYI